MKPGHREADEHTTWVRRIKIFGERNTGTNYVEFLLAANLDCEICPGNLSNSRRFIYKFLHKVLPYPAAWKLVETDRDTIYSRRFERELGWKHARIPNLPIGRASYPAGVGIVAVVKNPYSWLISLHKRPYQNENLKSLNFGDFIRHPWLTVGREHSNTDTYPTPIHLWNDKVNSYAVLQDFAPSAVVRYEDVLSSPAAFIERVANSFYLPAPSVIRLPSSSTKNDGRSTSDIADYYLRQRWRSKLADRDIAFINEILDPSLMAKWKYAFLPSPSPDELSQPSTRPDAALPFPRSMAKA